MVNKKKVNWAWISFLAQRIEKLWFVLSRFHVIVTIKITVTSSHHFICMQGISHV